MSFYDLVALAEAGHTVYEILDFVGLPMFGYQDKGLPWPKPGQFKGSARNPKTVSEYKPMPKKSEKKISIPIGESTPPRKRPRVDYPTPDRTPNKPPKRKLPPITRPSKKTKISPMPKAKNEKINGEHANVVTNTSGLTVSSGSNKLSKGMTKKGEYIHCHNYAEKLSTNTSGYRLWDSLKPTIAYENFANINIGTVPVLAGAKLTALNTSVSANDLSNVIRANPIDAAGTVAAPIQDYTADFSYYQFKSINHVLHLKNMFNLPVRVTCYWVTPKQDCRATPTNDFFVCQNQMNLAGLADLANTTTGTLGTTFGYRSTKVGPATINGRQKSFMATDRGVLPTDLAEWRKRWKVLKKDTINLPSGGLVVHSVNFKYNKLFSERYATNAVRSFIPPVAPLNEFQVDGPLLIKNLSVVPFICIEGYLSQADNGEALDQPTFGNMDVNIGVESKAKISWVTSNKVAPKQSGFYTTLINASATSEEFINAVDADANGDPAN